MFKLTEFAFHKKREGEYEKVTASYLIYRHTYNCYLVIYIPSAYTKVGEVKAIRKKDICENWFKEKKTEIENEIR